MRTCFRFACAGLWLHSACNQADPTDGTQGSDFDGFAETGDGTGTTGSEQSPGASEYYPLVDGATWTYRHTAADATTWNEIIRMAAVAYEGVTAFEVRDNAGPNGENTISTIVRVGTQTLRVHKNVELQQTPVAFVDYEPGFLRYDNAWDHPHQLDWMYDRTEHDPLGALVDRTVRHQIFTIESMSTSVTVPAGTFDCVQLVRERADTGEAKRFWFTAGVGKVKHQNLATGSREELAEYSIP